MSLTSSPYLSRHGDLLAAGFLAPWTLPHPLLYFPYTSSSLCIVCVNNEPSLALTIPRLTRSQNVQVRSAHPLSPHSLGRSWYCVDHVAGPRKRYAFPPTVRSLHTAARWILFRNSHGFVRSTTQTRSRWWFEDTTDHLDDCLCSSCFCGQPRA